jgi:hypothetical protein
MTRLVFMVYEKHIILTQKDKIVNLQWHFMENKTDYTACLKNAVNFLVALIYKMKFQGYF